MSCIAQQAIPECVYQDNDGQCDRDAVVLVRLDEGMATASLPLCEKHAGMFAVAMTGGKHKEKEHD